METEAKYGRFLIGKYLCQFIVQLFVLAECKRIYEENLCLSTHLYQWQFLILVFEQLHAPFGINTYQWLVQ